jgi:hypothetical protein
MFDSPVSDEKVMSVPLEVLAEVELSQMFTALSTFSEKLSDLSVRLPARYVSVVLTELPKTMSVVLPYVGLTLGSQLAWAFQAPTVSAPPSQVKVWAIAGAAAIAMSSAAVRDVYLDVRVFMDLDGMVLTDKAGGREGLGLDVDWVVGGCGRTSRVREGHRTHRNTKSREEEKTML